MSEDEMAGQPHQLSGREFEQTPGGSEGQGSLMRLKSVRHSLATAARIKELLLIKWQKDLSVKEKICVQLFAAQLKIFFFFFSVTFQGRYLFQHFCLWWIPLIVW